MISDLIFDYSQNLGDPANNSNVFGNSWPEFRNAGQNVKKKNFFSFCNISVYNVKSRPHILPAREVWVARPKFQPKFWLFWARPRILGKYFQVKIINKWCTPKVNKFCSLPSAFGAAKIVSALSLDGQNLLSLGVHTCHQQN